MHRTSIFGIRALLGKSHGSYLFDANRGEEILDLFGMYSSLPLGYNHPAFDALGFREELAEYASVKVPNCEMRTPAAERFLAAFTGHPSMSAFKYFHFCCTGALAVEAAIKTAMVATGRTKVLTYANGFHGIYGYAGLLASSDSPAARRVAGFPYADFRASYPANNVAAVVVEPLHCTAGDLVNPLSMREVRERCDETGALLIFDEVQTGFGGTGTMWYFEQLGVTPDIVVFGKKSQVSGLMVRSECGRIFQTPEKLEATWDGDVLDMIRCRVILETYERDKVLENVKLRERQFAADVPGLRHVGLLLALDFESSKARDEFVWRMWREQRTIMIPTGERTVRWRPNLAITEAECEYAVKRTHSVLRAAA